MPRGACQASFGQRYSADFVGTVQHRSATVMIVHASHEPWYVQNFGVPVRGVCRHSMPHNNATVCNLS